MQQYPLWYLIYIVLQNLDLLKVVQGEVQSCVTELDKLKKVYMDDEHVSHDARDKAREAEEKYRIALMNFTSET